MAKPNLPTDQLVEIRKYPNRRYYDGTRSQHVTLAEMYRLICNGSNIEVTDSKSGKDITAKTLAQIILEHDPLKLGIFPSQLLHEVIRANESLVRDFVEQYFHQAFMAFAESQKHFEQYMRQAMGLGTQGPVGDWARMMFSAFGSPVLAQTGPSEGVPNGIPADQADDSVKLQGRVEELQGEIAALQEQLSRQ